MSNHMLGRCIRKAIGIVFICETAILAYTVPVTNRVDINFNLGWKYNQGNATNANTAAFSDGSWTSVNVPHSTKWVTPEDKTPYNGICWYRKHFTVPAAYQGRKVFVEFEGAMQYAEVWVNDALKITHEGGYMGFVIDITGAVSYGTTDNVIAVKVTSAGDDRWAPGNSNIDFKYFGGIYRDVTMRVTDNLHVTDPLFVDKVAGGGIFVTYPSVSAGSAVVAIKTDVVNENSASKSCSIVSDIVDAQGAVAATATTAASIAAGASNTFSQSLTITSPKLWHPNTPNLYTVHTTIKDGTTAVDYYKTRIGIRSIVWTHANGITINGQSPGFKAQGADMHQDIYGLGNAVPKRSIYYDMKRFKEAGLNFVRGSHYPHNKSFYDACDELGILVENAISGWQHFVDNDTFKNNTYKETRELIRRDRNHPCVAIWETQLNESKYSAAWAQTENTFAKAEFGTAQMYTCGTYAGGGWSNMSTAGSVPWDVMIGASQASIRSASTPQPVIICEYGSWDYGGETSTSDVTRQSADAPLLVQCNNIQESLNKNRALSWYSADAYWVFADYASYTTTGYPDNRLNCCGILDYYRIPKFSYYFFQSQRDPNVVLPGVNSGPMVHIANRWTSSSPTSVRVFSNCDKVSLYRDNTLIATQSPDNGANTTALLRPPFTFAAGSISGMLRAVGTIGGVDKAWDTVRTPGAATAIRLRPESADPLDVGGSDARLVWIDIVDANGTVVYGSTAQVALDVSGAGSVMGPASVTMKAGQLATWVRSGATAGSMTVTAKATGLTNGILTLNSNEASNVAGSVFIKPVVSEKSFALVSCMGNRTLVPDGFAKKGMLFSIYDISGKLVRSAVTRNQIAALNKASAGIYIIKAMKKIEIDQKLVQGE